MRLTVAVLVKGESARLGRALSSLQGLADEILLVTLPAQDARRVAAGAGLRVLETEAQDPRGTALRHCGSEWLLLLDDDETLAALDHALLREALHLTEVGGFRLVHRSYLRSGARLGLRAPTRLQGGRYDEGLAYSHGEDTPCLRLIRRFPELAEPGVEPETWLAQRGHRILDLDAVVHHFGRTDGAGDDRWVRTRFHRAVERRRREPEDPACLEEVLEAALQAGAWDIVLEAADARRRGPSPSPFACRFGTALALQGLNRHKEALSRFEALQAEAPDHAPLLAARAESLWSLGRAHEAQEGFGAALEADPGFTYSYLRLADLFEAHGLWEDARLVLEAGLDQNPLDLRLWEALVDRGTARKDARLARDAWNALQRIPDGGRGQWHQLLIHTLIAKDRRPEALDLLRRGLHAFPEHGELLALKQRMGA